MKKFLVIALALSLAACGATPAEEAADMPERDMGAAVVLDRTPAELPPYSADDFAKYDVNGDGYVNDEEIDVGKERGMTAGEKKDVRAKGRPVPTTNPKSPEPATTTEP